MSNTTNKPPQASLSYGAHGPTTRRCPACAEVVPTAVAICPECAEPIPGPTADERSGRRIPGSRPGGKSKLVIAITAIIIACLLVAVVFVLVIAQGSEDPGGVGPIKWSMTNYGVDALKINGLSCRCYDVGLVASIRFGHEQTMFDKFRCECTAQGPSTPRLLPGIRTSSVKVLFEDVQDRRGFTAKVVGIDLSEPIHSNPAAGDAVLDKEERQWQASVTKALRHLYGRPASKKKETMTWEFPSTGVTWDGMTISVFKRTQ